MGASKTSMGKKQYGSRLLKPAKPLLNGQPGKNSKLGLSTIVCVLVLFLLAIVLSVLYGSTVLITPFVS
jgi:hypothetical protein